MFGPSLTLEREPIDNLENFKMTLQESKAWMEEVVQEIDAFLLRLLR